MLDTRTDPSTLPPPVLLKTDQGDLESVNPPSSSHERLAKGPGTAKGSARVDGDADRQGGRTKEDPNHLLLSELSQTESQGIRVAAHTARLLADGVRSVTE